MSEIEALVCDDVKLSFALKITERQQPKNLMRMFFFSFESEKSSKSNDGYGGLLRHFFYC